MPFDIFKAILWNEGEGIETVDLNVTSRFNEARLTDQVLRSMVGNAREAGGSLLPIQRNAVASAPFLYALSGGDGYIVPGGGARQTTVRAGTILQQVGSPSGDASTLLPFTMADGAFTLTHAVGDATNPRIDVIEVKLELVDDDNVSRDFEDATTEALTTTSVNIKRRVQATFQIVAGTPSATPAYPTLTAGFCGLGAVLVPATHNAVFVAQTHYSDLRIPMGVKHIRTRADEFVEDVVTGTDWNLDSDGVATNALRRAALLSSLGPSTIYVPCPLAAHQRLVGIAIKGRVQYSAITANLLRVDATDGAAADVVVASLAGLFPASATPTVTYAIMGAIESGVAATSGNAKNAAGLGHGIWGNGRVSGCAAEDDNVVASTELALSLTITTGGSDLTIIQAVDWFYADGIV